jgi:hypothetical protein
MKKIVFWLFITTVSLFSNSFDKFSYYIAYDSSDATQYALVMPAISKIYTHKAGDILNMKLISDQFTTMPTYSSGNMCFSALKSGADGSSGASIMAGKCYEVKFFYIQKGNKIEQGYPFMLYYKPSQKLYEGLAGQSKSFKVVRDLEGIYANKSITSEDYTNFYFDINNSIIYLGQDALDIFSSSSSSKATVGNPPETPSLDDNSTDNNGSLGTPPGVPTVQ